MKLHGMMPRRLRAGSIVVLVAAIAALVGSTATPASAATYPQRKSTWKIAALVDAGPSYQVNKGGSLTISICHSYSNSASLGASFGPIKNYISATWGVTIEASYTACSGASSPVTKTGKYHWYGYATRWESKMYWGDRCGKGNCVPIYTYPIAQARWSYRVVAG